jgi:hypothetical protein
LAIVVAILTGTDAGEQRINNIRAIRAELGYTDGAILKKYAAVAAEQSRIRGGEKADVEACPREPGIVLNEEVAATGAVEL